MSTHDLDNPDYYLNRELSWLDFNGRVLEEAQDSSNPLLERVKFLAITANNLDEFFEVRVAGLIQLRESRRSTFGADRLTPAEQLDAIATKAHQQVTDQYRCWNNELLPSLAAEGIHFWEARQLTGEHQEFVARYWTEELEPVLTPIVIDQSHTFPSVLNKALCIGALLGTGRQTALGVATVPRVLPRILPLPNRDGELHFVSLAGIMDAMAGKLFSGYQVECSAPFRVTRNSELYVNEEEADNLLDEITEQLQNRRKGDAVRLEIAASAPDRLLHLLQEQFALTEAGIYRADGPVNLNRVMNLYHEVPRADLKDPPFTPIERQLPRDPDAFFASIRADDVLLHHPYEAFTTITNFISMAANDLRVLAIKQTIYRTGDDSEVAQALINAAERGKEVTVLVELKARGDEEANIEWAKKLEESGVHVVYGVMGLKTHCKLSMLVRRDDDKLRRYAHLGTGNYNQVTARLYTDLGLITAREDITSDVALVFNLLTAHSPEIEFQKLLVAPRSLMKGTIDRIERETEHARARQPAAIIAKMNGLIDPKVIASLYRASQAGVQIDLIVRGVCCLRPGLTNVSDNIRVYSIIGRFLEHSRVFYFANGGDSEIWAGSADWMNRNLRGRVEVVFPIEDARLKRRLKRELIDLALSDRVKARQLRADGNYVRCQPENDESTISMQQVLMEIANGGEPSPAEPTSRQTAPTTS